MQTAVKATIRISRRLFLLLVLILTEFVLVGVATIAVLPSGIFGRIPLWAISFFLLFKVSIAVIVTLIATETKPLQPITSLSFGVGYVLGHTVGLLTGGVLGGWLGGAFWAIVGFVAGYILVGRVGGKLGAAIATQLQKIFTVKENAG